MKILLLGAGGQIGTELLPVLAPLGVLTALRRDQLDLRDTHALAQRLRSERPDVLVNAAAYTAVDRAETEAALAMRVNAEAVGEMAAIVAQTGGLLVHYSTDYVFDGSLARPYLEDDPTAPINRYGESKLAGEHLIRDAGVRHFIFRTSWIYAQHGRNFLLTLLRLSGERDTLRVVQDQIGAPTWARQVANATGAVLGHCLAAPPDASAWQQWCGTYHLSAAGATSWHGFAQEILRLHQGGVRSERIVIEPITAAEYGAPARRPACSLLDNGKLTRQFGLQQEDWAQALRQCMALLPR